MERNTNIKFLVLICLLVVSCILSLLYGGSEHIDLGELSSNNFIFWHIRFPKTLTAIIAGCTLAVAGLILQIIFRNPLAGPYVLGISSGASLMVAMSILAGGSLHLMSEFFIGKTFIVLSAISGSFLITLLILGISKKVNSNVVLLLIGLMLSQICGAIQTALEYFSDANSLKSFVTWGMGSLANTTNIDLAIYLPIALICLLAVLFFVKPLNALLLGENYSQNIGVNFKTSRFYLILISSVLTGLTTAFCGPIAFIGTAVPILSRMVFKNSKQHLHVISCLLLGSIILLLSDAFANSLIKNISLPINMITTFIGAPLVIYLMFKNKSW
ncbi:MAG: iron ABC transporter permease [Bacteroidetes bacterium]|nr:iron ABC transporter permease [Bacteroidota bacterium]